MYTEFIRATALKKMYAVSGHFYEIALDACSGVRCRSVLEIVSKERGNYTRVAGGGRRSLPDAIFIMMNPGSSQPLGGPANIDRGTIAARKVLVPTKPDTTQYQVMRVMRRMGWRHIRVLNLSDMRETQSRDFVTAYKLLEEEAGIKDHSIFDAKRKGELHFELQRKAGGPLICAWGVNAGLDSLVKTAVPILKATGPCHGLSKRGSKHKYFHPLPTLQADKENWVNNLCKGLRIRLAKRNFITLRHNRLLRPRTGKARRQHRWWSRRFGAL